MSGKYSVAQFHVFAGLAFAFPLLLAGVALAMGVWAIFERPGALRAAIFTATAVIIALYLETFVNLSDYYGYSTAYVGPALQSLGLTVSFAGTFIILVDAFMGWRRSAPA